MFGASYLAASPAGTICILITHFQTVKIIVSMRLPWPPSVMSVASSVGIDIIDIDLPGVWLG